MDSLIQIKRGSGETPALADGELGYNKDTKILSVGTDNGNVDIGRPILTMTQTEYNNLGNKKDEDAIYILESDDTVVTESVLKDTVSGYVPTSRTVNGKALSSNITLSASDVGAAPNSYGLGKAQKITWDTINRQEPGWYYIAGENTICGHTASYWYMHVAAYGSGTAYCTQTLYSVIDDKTFERRQNDGVWSAWVDVSPSSYSKYDLLWSNASRESSFAAQTITVDTTAYNFLAVEVAYNEKEMNGTELCFVGMRKKNYGDTVATLTAHLITSTGSFNTVSRKLTIKSGRGSIIAGGGIANDGSANDKNAIPVKIYGIRGI